VVVTANRFANEDVSCSSDDDDDPDDSANKHDDDEGWMCSGFFKKEGRIV